MRKTAAVRILAVLGLLAGVLTSPGGAQEEAARPAIDPRHMIRSDQLRAIAQPVRRADVAATQPTAALAPPTLDLLRIKSTLGTAVRVSQYDPATNVTSDLSDASVAQLKDGQYIAVSSDRIQLEPLRNAQGDQYSSFPSLLIMTSSLECGPPPCTGNKNLRVDNYSDGFVWNLRDAAFEATIAVAVTDMDDPRSSAALQIPIVVKVSSAALLGQVAPVAISQLGFAGERDVVVRAQGHTDPVAITLRHDVDPQAPQNIALSLARPTLTVSANPSEIAAFGIEATEITINANGSLPEGFALTLDSDSGIFDPKTVAIGAQGTATTRLWSGSIGGTAVRVLDDRFLVSGKTVRFLSPLRFLIAVLFGAAVGAAFIYLWQRAKGRASMWRSAAALVFGIGITIAVFAGFEIPQMLNLPAGRAGLVVPAATAFIGTILMSTIYAALGGGSNDKSTKPEKKP